MANPWDSDPVVPSQPAAAAPWASDPIVGTDKPGILQGIRSSLQQADTQAQQYLRPSPDDNPVLQFAKKATMTVAHLGAGLSQLPVNLAIAAQQGPVASQLVNPETGAFSPDVSPEAKQAVGLLADGIRFGPLEAAPAAGGISFRPFGGAPKVAPLVNGVDTVEPAVAARAAETAGPATPMPTNFAATPTTASVAPTTAAAAKQVANAYYDVADKAGGTLAPHVTDQFVNAVTSKLPQTEAGKAVLGQTQTAGLVDRLQQLRGQPLTLKAAQEIDEGLGNLIDGEYKPTGLTKEGSKLAGIQRDFRDQIENAGPNDVTGGTAGFDALGPARKAWSQAMKMSDLERIQQRADLTDNPATTVRTQLRALLSNPARLRGYSPDEVAALQAAAERGTMGSLLHVFGSRLIPIGALSHGPIAAGVTHVGTSILRDMASGLASGRLNNARQVLGQGVPPMPGVMGVTPTPTPVNRALLGSPLLAGAAGVPFIPTNQALQR